MKYLLYYSLDNKFVNDQIAARGDGKNVVSVVDGVAWTRDAEKAYYRYAPNVPEEVTTYYVTIHYKDIFGETIANDDIVPVEVYNNKVTKQTLVGKSIDGFNLTKATEVVKVTGNTDYTFYYISSDIDLKETPLTFSVISGGNIAWKTTSVSSSYSIEYKKNDGDWTTIAATTGGTLVSVEAGDKVSFRGNNNYYSTWVYNNSDKTWDFDNGASFSGTGNVSFNAYGNIMSLINKNNFPNITLLSSRGAFGSLFYNCTGLNNAWGLLLPATTLADGCYSSMFFGCTNLTIAPSILPATTLAVNCYQYMFGGCTSLVQGPSAIGTSATTMAASACTSMFGDCTSLTQAPELPAETLASYCYSHMFIRCTSLTRAPELPATTLAYYCYRQMFFFCRNLTTAPSILPATTLKDYCYYDMFEGCTSLTQAPELPATTLAYYCYSNMFRDCTNLNYIKCLATNISATNSHTNWVSGVQTTSGTFVKAAGISESTWGRSNNGIPSNWTVQDATS